MGATLYRDFGRTGADTAIGAVSAATASVTSTAAAAAAPPALTSSRDTKGGEPDDGREGEGGSKGRGVRRLRGIPGARRTREEETRKPGKCAWGTFRRGTAGTDKGGAIAAGAPASSRISSLSSLFPAHTALQPSLLPSWLVIRTQPQAEVQ